MTTTTCSRQAEVGFLRLCYFFLLALSLGSCNTPATDEVDASPSAGPPAEERFDNDRALVERIDKLKGCTFERGIIDSTCSQLHDLQTYLRQCKLEPSRSKTARATLITLLRSRKELTRLAATQALAGFKTNRELTQALTARLADDDSAQVRAAALSQLCQRDRAAGQKQARKELAPAASATAEPLRLAAAFCLARGGADNALQKELLAALAREKVPAIQAQLCAALGRTEDPTALPAILPLLDKPVTAGPCSTAVARIGSEAAFQALLALVRSAGTAPLGKLHPQHLIALQAFSDKPFFKTQELTEALARVAGDQRLGQELRCRAVQQLTKLAAGATLRQLRDRLEGLACQPN